MESWKTDVIQIVINMIKYRKFQLLLVAIKRKIKSRNRGWVNPDFYIIIPINLLGIWFNGRRGGNCI